MDTYRINNIKIYPFESMEQLILKIESIEHAMLIAINANKILFANDKFKGLINSDQCISYADGIYPVIMMKRNGFKSATRIPGVELWLKIVERFYKEKSFFLIGGTSEVIEKAVERLEEDFPAINIKGFHNGYFKDRNVIIEKIKAVQPDIIFVAMGSPKQEYFIHQCFEEYPALYQGLGGSFDVFTGKVKRAPKFFQKIGMEGVYRNLSDFRRAPRIVKILKGLIHFHWKNK